MSLLSQKFSSNDFSQEACSVFLRNYCKGNTDSIKREDLPQRNSSMLFLGCH